MNVYTITAITAIAVALALDAFAVAIASGAYLKNVSPRQFFRLSWHFGLFQALMPAIGWYAGTGVKQFIENFAHYIACGLLFLVATSMIIEAFKDKDDNKLQKDPTKGAKLIVLSVATSIDALSVGFSLSMLDVTIGIPIAVIGITAALFTIAGLFIGSKSVKIPWLQKYSELIGACVLYGIGIYILLENNAFSV